MLNGLINRDDADVTLSWNGYDAMQPELRDLAQDAAVRIHTLQRSMINSAAELGEILLNVKGNFSHGEWGAWLNGEFNWSDRTAQHWMNAAVAVRKNEKFSFLPVSAQYVLGSKGTPESAVEEISERMDTGEVLSVKEVKATVNKHKPGKTSAEPAAVVDVDLNDYRPLPDWVAHDDGTETRPANLDGSQRAQRNLRICEDIRIGLAQMDKVLHEYEKQTGDFHTHRKLQPLLKHMKQTVVYRMRALGREA